MTSTQLDPVGSGYHPSVANENEEEERDDYAANHLGLLDIQKEDTVDSKEYNAESESERGQQTGAEKPPHAGFWSHDLVNVRLHVIKLWCRTGKELYAI